MSYSTNGRKDFDVYENTVPEKSAEQGVLVNQDAIITAIKAICAKLDADAGVTDEDYASTISDALSKVQIR